MKNHVMCLACLTTFVGVCAAAALGLAEPPTTQPAAAAAPAPAADQKNENPAAEGFDAAGSDAKAIEIADLTMKAMGGREAWDRTRYITWRFFGLIRHVWDKKTGLVRTELPDQVMGAGLIVVVHDINTKQGRAWRDGKVIDNDVELPRILSGAYRSFMNDSAWMFMPYRLKDSGVTLKYKGEGAMVDNRPADILTVTVNGAALEPHNKYDIYVSKDTRLVEQWSSYRSTDDPEPARAWPWKEWKQFGRIKLAQSRGHEKSMELRMTEIAVFDELPESVFTSPEPIDLGALTRTPAPAEKPAGR